MGESWTEAREDPLKMVVQVLCSTWSPPDSVQIFLQPAHLIFVSLSSAWTAVHVGMALRHVDCFLHTAN